MRVVSDAEIDAWFASLKGEAEDFEWDAGNRSKNLLKHGVSRVDVESLIAGDVRVFARSRVDPCAEVRGESMKKQSASSSRAKSTRRDAQVKEFETRDLGKALATARRDGALKVHRRAKSLPTSIVLAPELVARLRSKAEQRGIGYQTMLKIIVAEHLDDY